MANTSKVIDLDRLARFKAKQDAANDAKFALKGEGGSIATADKAGIVKPGGDFDITDDGNIYLASEDIEACRAARKTIETIGLEPEIGALYYGRVSNIRSDFGAWVELAPGKDGLVKIKDLEFKRTEKVEDVLNIGDMTWVKVTEIDEKGRVNLSRKDALKELAAAADKK